MIGRTTLSAKFNRTFKSQFLIRLIPPQKIQKNLTPNVIFRKSLFHKIMAEQEETVKDTTMRDLIIMAVIGVVAIVIFAYINHKRKSIDSITIGADMASAFDDSYIGGMVVFGMLVTIVAILFSGYLALMSGIGQIACYALAGVVAGLLYALLQIFNSAESITKDIATVTPDVFVNAVQAFEDNMAMVVGIMVFATLSTLLIKKGAQLRTHVNTVKKHVGNAVGSIVADVQNSKSAAGRNKYLPVTPNSEPGHFESENVGGSRNFAVLDNYRAAATQEFRREGRTGSTVPVA